MSGDQEQRGPAPGHATGAVVFVPLDEIAGDESFRLRPDGDVSQLATSLGRLGQLAPVELRPWPGAATDGARWQVVAGFRRLAATRLLARERVLARLHQELTDADAWGLALGEALLHEPLTGEDLEALRGRLRATGLAPWAEELLDDALVRAPVAAALRERFFEFLTGVPLPAGEPEPQAEEGAQEQQVQDRQVEQPPASPIPLPPPPQAEPAAPQATAPVALPEPVRPVQALATGEPAGEPQPERAVAEGDGRPEGEVVEVHLTPEELAQDLAERLSALNQDLATAVEIWQDLPSEGRRLLVEQARYVAALLPYMEAE